ncbi:hypothetical protein HYPSUDRAFT_80162 [Hypholoma sublateritium FD-334 SS-4]|uniref:Uncharacterized protein n=1 Tax=Hypholoma sublateritium (strain FD-334 SS-4) TaxID=945553 RepID=A0A0D2LZF1_HYPSF|nr:hypothetical protein HYPSUDRAFT_80162 [Hypholoma sublateritium FD-334 SS-4]
MKRTASQRPHPRRDKNLRRGPSPLTLDSRELDFFIIKEDPSTPKDKNIFIAYCPTAPVRTWTAPYEAASSHPPPQMSSFPVTSAIAPEDTKPPPKLNSGLRTPTEDATRPPHPRLSAPGGSQRIHHPQHIPVAGPSCRLGPVRDWGTGARRVRRPSEAKAPSLPRLPQGVRVIARPGEWDVARSHTTAGQSIGAASGVSSSTGSGSGPISPSHAAVGAPTHLTPSEPIQRTFWNTVL